MQRCCYTFVSWRCFYAVVLEDAWLFLFLKLVITRWIQEGTFKNWTKMHYCSKKWSNEWTNKWFWSLVNNMNWGRWCRLECYRRIRVGIAAVSAVTTTAWVLQSVKLKLLRHSITMDQINLNHRLTKQLEVLQPETKIQTTYPQVQVQAKTKCSIPNSYLLRRRCQKREMPCSKWDSLGEVDSSKTRPNNTLTQNVD